MTCSDCALWHDKGPDANAIGGPHQGECRERVHSQFMPQGPGRMGLVVYYPVLAGDMDACSHFQPRTKDIVT